VGVEGAIVEQALRFLSPEARKWQKDVEQLDQMRAELAHLQTSLEAEKKRTAKEREKFESIIARFQKEKEQMLNQSIKRAERKVDTLIRESKIDDIFKRHQKLEQIKTDLPQIVKAKTPVTTDRTSIETAEEFVKAFPPGSKVFIPSLGYDGIVQGKPNAKDEVPVLSRSIRLTLPWQQLKPPETAGNPTKDILRKSGRAVFTPAQQDRVVDVRGLSTEEAIEQLELQLDTASLGQEDRVKIVHGHGAEILKKAVRGYLSRSVYVKKWFAGTAETGGDGVTWAEIKD
jgi:DNA mismatch repair protein MutS2